MPGCGCRQARVTGEKKTTAFKLGMSARSAPFLPMVHHPRRLSRNACLALAVVGLHAGGLYALQSGLMMRAVEVVVPVEVLARFIEPAPPKIEQQPRPPQRPPQTKPQTVVPKPQTTPLPPPPKSIAVVSTEPSPNAVTGSAAPQPTAPPVAAPVSAAPPAPPAVPTPRRIQLPDSNADYLSNRPPAYPPLSKRLGEQGKVVVRVFIDTEGNATQAEIRTSSGHDRLDQTALKTVQTWKYVPGKVNGEAKAMWFNVPISFALE
jgi:periplasmic protein TonB